MFHLTTPQFCHVKEMQYDNNCFHISDCNTEVKAICDHFKGVLGELSLSDVQAEWAMLKALVFQK